MAIASCPYLLDFTSVVSRNSSNCIAILGCGSISVKLYPALPSGGGVFGCHLQWGATLLHEGASLMVLIEKKSARLWCMCLIEGMNIHYPTVVQYMISYLPNFIKDYNNIKSNEPLVFRGEWSFWQVNEQFDDIFTCKEMTIIRFKSPTTWIPQNFGCWTFKEYMNYGLGFLVT